MAHLLKDIEVPLKTDPGKAVIEGKTAVHFEALVKLILQRKVFALFKSWGKEPVIIGSELLTAIASAPQDSQENRGHMILVTLGAGIVAGVFLLGLAQILLLLFEISLGMQELLIIVGSIAGVSALVYVLMGMQHKGSAEKVTETMEKVASFLK